MIHLGKFRFGKFNVKALVVVFQVTLLAGCSSLLYYPSRHKFVDEKKLEIQPEEVRFESSGRLQIGGWRFISPIEGGPYAVIVHFHGNGQNLSSHFVSLYWVLRHGYDVLIFDYPGYGPSEGEPSPKATMDAGKAALRFAQRLYPDTPLAVLGQSLGGAVALRAVEEIKNEVSICHVTIDSSFPSYRQVVRSVLRKQWWTWPLQPLSFLLFSDRYAPRNLDRLSIPALVFHGEKDPIVDFELGMNLYEQLSEPKLFVKVEDEGHTQAFVGKYRETHRKTYLAQLEAHCLSPRLSAH